MKKSELRQIIKEEIHRVLNKNKILLNECWISTTWEDLFDENPKIYDLLRNNLLDMDGDKIEYRNDNKFTDELSTMGGAMGYDGIWDWNKPRVLNFIKDLYETKTINKDIYDALLKELNKNYYVFSTGYLEDMVEKVGHDTNRWSDKKEMENWYNYAKQEVEYIKKGFTQKDFKNRHKDGGPKICNI